MPIDLQATSLDPTDPQYAAFLAHLPGNILKGHGRPHTRNLFFRFADPKAVEENREAFGSLLQTFPPTSMAEQLEQRRIMKEGGTSEASFVTVLLSSEGYQGLGFEREELAAKFNEPDVQFPLPVSARFVAGHKESAPRLGDVIGQWDEAFRENEKAPAILLILANASPAKLDELIQLNAFPAGLELTTKIEGRGWKNGDGNDVEHFGYVDGRSQPLFLKEDLEQEEKNFFDPSAALSLALIPDPLAPEGAEDCFGSYFVFRKLEQNVRGFKAREAANELDSLATALNLRGEDREIAGAYVVGRFENGVPVVTSPDDTPATKAINDFNYDGDVNATKCPFHAHIRKMNPRGETKKFGQTDEAKEQIIQQERSHRIVRRGIPYGVREQHPASGEFLDQPEGGVGLLFMCYQASIANQFAFMQQAWANNQNFIEAAAGLDPVIGQDPRQASFPQEVPVKYGEANKIRYEFSGFVKNRGGEFFFAPSLPFLYSIVPPSKSLRSAS